MTDQQVLPPGIPTGDQKVMAQIQAFLDMARVGKIAGVVIIGVAGDGSVYSTQCLPANPNHIHVAMGALNVMIINLNDILRTFVKQVSASPIMRPGSLFRGQ